MRLGRVLSLVKNINEYLHCENQKAFLFLQRQHFRDVFPQKQNMKQYNAQLLANKILPNARRLHNAPRHHNRKDFKCFL